MTQTILFPRGKTFVAARIIKTVLEPLGNTRQVVFFCQDKSGRRYRVPKGEVVLTSSSPQSKPKSKKKARKVH